MRIFRNFEHLEFGRFEPIILCSFLLGFRWNALECHNSQRMTVYEQMTFLNKHWTFLFVFWFEHRFPDWNKREKPCKNNKIDRTCKNKNVLSRQKCCPLKCCVSVQKCDGSVQRCWESGSGSRSGNKIRKNMGASRVYVGAAQMGQKFIYGWFFWFFQVSSRLFQVILFFLSRNRY